MQTIASTRPQPQPLLPSPVDFASPANGARYIDDVGLPWFKFRRANLRDPRITRLGLAAKWLWTNLLDACATRSCVDAQGCAWPVHEANRHIWLDLLDLADRAGVRGEDLRDALHELWRAKLISYRVVDEDTNSLLPTHFGQAEFEALGRRHFIIGLEQWSLYEEGTGQERPRAAQRQRVSRANNSESERDPRNCHTDLDLNSEPVKLGISQSSSPQNDSPARVPDGSPVPDQPSGIAKDQPLPPEGRASGVEEPDRSTKADDAPKVLDKPDETAAVLWDGLLAARSKHGLPHLVGVHMHHSRAVEAWTDMLLMGASVSELQQQIEARCLEALTSTVDYCNSNGWANPVCARISAQMACTRREAIVRERDRCEMQQYADPELEDGPAEPAPEPARRKHQPAPEPEPTGPSIFEAFDPAELAQLIGEAGGIGVDSD